MKDFYLRLKALTKKEFNQLLRDNSSLMIGILLPILLIFIIGYGISLDVRKVPAAIVLEDPSPTAYDMLSFTRGSDYFSPHYAASMKEAEQLMHDRRADVIIRVPSDFTERLYRKDARVQVIVYGVDSAKANICKNYVETGLRQWLALNMRRFAGAGYGAAGLVTVESRMWFNDGNSSTWYFIPGIIVLITTLVGVVLTALVMAREWERGTFESLFVTPVKPLELLLAKVIPYFCVAMVGFFICLAAAKFLFAVPIHGSLLIIILCSMLYMIVALSVGLTVSAVTKNQFMACQVALVISVLPTIMLSGFMFDLRSVPGWISAVGYALPPTYYMQLLKSLFLAGNNWPLIVKNSAILLLYAAVFSAIAVKVTRKRLE